MRLRSILGLLLGAASAAALETVHVDADTTLRSFAGPVPVGVNVNYLKDADAQRPPGSRPLAAALTGLGMRWLRYPGGEKSDNLLWTARSGTSLPIAPGEAVPQPLQPRLINPEAWPGNDRARIAADGGFVQPPMDFDAFIALCRATGAEPVLVVAYDECREITGRAASPGLDELIASAAAWVRYANRTRGYGVRYWSIGNESWFRPGLDAATYAGHVRRFAAAMRAVDPDLLIGAHGTAQGWLDTVAERCGDVVDWLDIHDYPVWNWDDGFRQYQGARPNLAAAIGRAALAVQHAPAARREHLRILATEVNAIDYGERPWTNRNDLGHALVAFDMLGQHLAMPRLDAVLAWNTRWVVDVPPTPGTVADAIVNGGFTADLAGWQVRNGERLASPAGAAGAVLAGHGGAWATQDVAIPAGGTWTLTFSARTTATAVWSGMGIDFLAAGGGKLGGCSATVTATQGWQRCRAQGTAPAGTVRAQVWLVCQAGEVTTLVDDVALTDRVEPAITDVLDSANAPTPLAHAVAAWTRFGGSRLVAAASDGGSPVYASLDGSGDRLCVFLLNRAASPQPVALDLGGFRPAAGRRHELAGSGPEDLAPAWREAGALAMPLDEVLLPATSLTVLELQRRR